MQLASKRSSETGRTSTRRYVTLQQNWAVVSLNKTENHGEKGSSVQYCTE